jgi:DNA-binding transcriptional LysR family regulator
VSELASVDLNLLVSLELLLDEGSVRGAARRAHVTPSAMSHTLGRLRTLFDDELLVRAGRGMVATPRATALREPVKELLAQARGILDEARRFDPARLRRRFRVVCTDHVSTVLQRPLEALLQAEAPGVDLLVAPLVPESMADLRRGTVDASVGVFPDAPPETRMQRLFSDRFVTVFRPDHPRLATGEVGLDAFLAEAHVLVAPRGTAEGRVDRVLRDLGHERRIARAFPSFLAALWHVAESDHLLTVSERLARAVAPRLPLRMVPTPLDLEDYAIVLAWHPRLDKAVEDVWFRGLLRRAAAELPGLDG